MAHELRDLLLGEGGANVGQIFRAPRDDGDIVQVALSPARPQASAISGRLASPPPVSVMGAGSGRCGPETGLGLSGGKEMDLSSIATLAFILSRGIKNENSRCTGCSMGMPNGTMPGQELVGMAMARCGRWSRRARRHESRQRGDGFGLRRLWAGPTAKVRRCPAFQRDGLERRKSLLVHEPFRARQQGLGDGLAL